LQPTRTKYVRIMFKKILSSQLRVNMFSGVAATTVNTVVLAVAYPLYLHFLDYEKYGVWLVLSVVLTFAQLGNLGIGPAVMKLVAEEYGRKNIEGIQKYVTTALALLCISGTVALIVILTFKNSIIVAFKLSGENAKTVSWLLPYVGVLSIYVFMVQVFESVLSGLGRMDLTNYIQSVGRVAAVIVAAVLLYSDLGIVSLLIGSTASYLLIHIAYFVCIWSIAPISFLKARNIDAQCGKRLLRFGGAVFGGSLISMLFNPFNKLMLSRYVGVAAVPIYEIAFQSAVQVRAFLETALRPILPEISRLSGLATIVSAERIRTINRRLIKLVLWYGSPFYVLLFLASGMLMRFWLRENYNSTLLLPFRLILLGTFLNLLAVPAYHTLLGLGKVRNSIISAIIISGGNFVLVLGRFILTGHVSVTGIFAGLIFLFATSTVYLMGRAYREMTFLQAAVATNS
jgi:O-antigen/teichoic acid export membrane protein